MIHELKIYPEYFKAVTSGQKTFEVRRNDRDFQVGDFLALNEHDPQKGYTGRCCIVEIAYILDTKMRIQGQTHVVLAIKPCCLNTASQEKILTRHDRYQVPIYLRPAESEV